VLLVRDRPALDAKGTRLGQAGPFAVRQRRAQSLTIIFPTFSAPALEYTGGVLITMYNDTRRSSTTPGARATRRP
jgi:hypothetical protein